MGLLSLMVPINLDITLDYFTIRCVNEVQKYRGFTLNTELVSQGTVTGARFVLDSSVVPTSLTS